MARYFQSRGTRPVSQFVPLPLDFLQNKIQQRQAQRDKYESLAGSPADFKIDSIARTLGSEETAVDRLRHQELNEESRRRAEEISNLLAEGDDLNKAERKLLELDKWRREQLDPTGEAGKIGQRFKERQEFQKRVEGAKLGKAGEDIMRRADYAYRQQGYIGDPSLNQQYSPIALPEYLDREKLARDVATDIPTIAAKVGATYDTNRGIWVDKTTKRELRTEDMITEALNKGLITNEKYRDYTNVLAQNKAFNVKINALEGGASEEAANALEALVLKQEQDALAGIPGAGVQGTLQGDLIDYGKSFVVQKTEDIRKWRKDPYSDDTGRKNLSKEVYTATAGLVQSNQAKASDLVKLNKEDETTIAKYESDLKKYDPASREYQITKDNLKHAKKTRFYRDNAVINGLKDKGVDINKTADKIINNPKYLATLYGDIDTSDPGRLKELVKRDLLRQGNQLIDKLGDGLWSEELEKQRMSGTVIKEVTDPKSRLSIWSFKSDLVKELGDYDLDFETQVAIPVTQLTGNKNTYLNEEKGNIKELLKTTSGLMDYITGTGFDYNPDTDDFNLVDVTDSGETMIQVKRTDGGPDKDENSVALIPLPGGFEKNLGTVGINLRKDTEAETRYATTAEQKASTIGLANKIMANSMYSEELDLHPIGEIPVGSSVPFRGVVVKANEDRLGNRYYTINNSNDAAGNPIEYDSEGAVKEVLGDVFYKTNVKNAE